MGRKSLAPQRQEEILGAFERCVVRSGFNATTIADVAEEAGMQRTLVFHYFGNRETLLRAAIERWLSYYLDHYQAMMRGVPERKRLSTTLDYLFGGPFSTHVEHRVFEAELQAMAGRSEEWGDVVREAMLELVATLDRELSRAYPDAPEERVAQTAYGIACLAQQNTEFVWLGFGEHRHAQARASADQLVAALAAEYGA